MSDTDTRDTTDRIVPAIVTITPNYGSEFQFESNMVELPTLMLDELTIKHDDYDTTMYLAGNACFEDLNIKCTPDMVKQLLNITIKNGRSGNSVRITEKDTEYVWDLSEVLFHHNSDVHDDDVISLHYKWASCSIGEKNKIMSDTKLTLDIIKSFEMDYTPYRPDHDDFGYTHVLPKSQIDVVSFHMLNGDPCESKSLEGLL